MKTIKVTIAPNGTPTVEAEGFQGGACKAATKPILDALTDEKHRKETEKTEAFIATGNQSEGGLYA